MRITELLIERFGIWRDLSLPLDPSRVNVLYGPNEAGKSTMMRFIRGMLYGFRPLPHGVQGRVARPQKLGGALRIEQAGCVGEIRRRLEVPGERVDDSAAGAGLLTVRGLDDHAPAEALLAELLAGVEDSVFERVFAVGLSELQELGTLNHDDVARHVYGLSLGPDGQRLLEIMQAAATHRRTLIGEDGLGGELGALMQREARLTEEITALDGLLDQHVQLSRDRDDLEQEIATLKSRRADHQRNLRGYLFLERVWNPWNQVREYRAELARIPAVAAFPDGGVERLDRLEEELASAARCRDALLAEAAEFRKEAETLEPPPELQQHAGTMQAFVDQRTWIQEIVEAAAAAELRVQEEQQRLDEQVAAIGSDWSQRRLESVDTSPSAHHRLVAMAREYQTQTTRNGKFRRYLKRMSKACHQRGVELQDRLREVGGRSLDETLADTRDQLAALESLAGLRLRVSELKQRRESLTQELNALAQRPPLPKWMYALLIFFAVGGIAGAIVGAMSGLTGNVLAGAMWATLGITCGLLAWGLKSHFEQNDRDAAERLAADADALDVQLRETREEIARITGNDVAARDDDSPETTAEQIRNATQQLSELERLAAVDRRTQAMRRRMSELRSRFQRVQRDLSTVRHNWCELLKQLGIGETVRIDEAFEIWQRIVEADQQRRQWQKANDDLGGHRRLLQSFQRRLEDLGRRMPSQSIDAANPLGLLEHWDDTLAELQKNQVRQRQLRRDEKARRREAAEYQSQIDELKTQRSALLVQGGASTRDEFEQRAEWALRRRECEELLEIARSELDAAAAAEPELAIVEDDLLAYDPAENGERVKELNAELESIERELQDAFELLGRTKQELRTLESDRRSTELRFELKQVQGELRRAAQRWYGLQLAAQTSDRLRTRFERTCQPATLAAASKYLNQLTGGRYTNIWAPLGQRRLCIEDDRQEPLTVEQLSNGTREQLFLAIRLAMVRELQRQNVELPLVLDDVFVNFDQTRTEAAVETLIDFAREGQQVLLFTCHLHLAQLFENRGIDPVWLPSHEQTLEERLAG